MRGAVLRVALALGLVGVAGCKKRDAAVTPAPPGSAPDEEAPTLAIRVTAEADGNGGRPFYAVVRAVTLEGFVEDQYQEIAALVVAPDETVLASFLVFPGRTSEVVIAKPKGSVGVYCLLTAASGTTWKRRFDAPETIAVVAGRDRLLEGR